MHKRTLIFILSLFLLMSTACSSENKATNQVVESTEVVQSVETEPAELAQIPTATATTEPTVTASATPIPSTETPLPTSTPTSTPTSEPTLTPTTEAPSESITLAQAAVGSAFTVDRVETTDAIIVGDKDDPNPETKQYTLAYDENGMIIARFSAENGGEGQWIAGGPFANEEINGGYSNFPCRTNPFGFCGARVWVSSFVAYGLYTDGTAIQLLDRQGNPTPFYMEAGVIGHYIDVHGEQHTIMIPIMVANENTDLRMTIESFEEEPLPLHSFSDIVSMFNYRYFRSHSTTATYYDDPSEINYWSDENAVMPTLGFGDVVTMAFPVPGRSTSGNKEFADTFAFLQPLISSYYFSNSYNEFLTTGDVSLLEDATISFMKINGIPLVIPSSAIIWDVDVYR